MNPSPDDRVSRLLKLARTGNTEALNEFLSLVLPDIRKMAMGLMKKESPGHTLQPTALVNQALLVLGFDLSELREPYLQNFFGLMCTVMRNVLRDHARARSARKRGGKLRNLPDNVEQLAQKGDSQETMSVLEGFQRLREQDSLAAEILEQKFYFGLRYTQIAEIFGRSEKTIERNYKLALAWLKRWLGQQE